MNTEPKNEDEMRKEKAPRPKTLEELNEYINSLTERQHDYGTCVYAMSLAAQATFNYVAGKTGCTGFQAQCADLDFLRGTRNINGPFIILKAEDMLYPQYDLTEKLKEAMENWKPWAAEECSKLLKTERKDSAHPDVKAHWEKLASCKAEPT